MEDMVHILGYNSEAGPREIMKIRTDGGDSGWLIRFFDSAFFCEWIAISYLYKYEHQGVRDYLCNRMYALPDAGIEAYLAQLCYMLVHRSSPGLDRYVVDMCAKSLRIALKVHWFLLAELEEGSGDLDELSRLQERCQMSAQRGNWPPLVQPKKVESSPSPSSKSRMFKHFLSSKGLLNLTSSPSPPPKPSSSPVSPMPAYIDQEPKTLAEESELPSNVFKKLMPGTKVRDALVKKFSTKEDGGNVEQAKENEAQPRENEADSFFHRFLRNKDVDDDNDDDDKAGHSEELVRSESLFRRLFPEKVDNDEKLMSKATEEDSFFRRLLFRDKADDKDNAESNHRDHEHEKGNACLEEEEVSDFSLFRRFFRVHPESNERPAVSITEGSAPNSENAPANESFLKKFFREHSSEDSNSPNLRKEDSFSPSIFLMKLKLFKDRTDESVVPVSDSVGENNKLQDAPLAMDANGFHESARLQHTDDCNDTLSETLTPRRKTKDTGFQMDVSSKNSYAGGSGATRMTFSKSVASGSSSLLVTSTSAPTSLLIKLPGSPKRTTEKIVSKPPLPKVSSSQLRKGAYHATLDFIRSLCEISTGLVDVFPMEDRWKSLHESLVELNGLLKSAQNDGGVCFPMGTGLYRIVHISEDEYTLLNSRERAPYSICLEVLQCDEQSPVRETKEAGSQKLSRGGIPLANGDVQLQQPPPWAYPVWNPSHAQRSSTNNTLRAASKAIDDAMNNIWDVKSKFVHVSLSVAQRCIDDAQDQTNEPDDHHPVVVDRDPLQTDSKDCGRELPSLNSSTFICTDPFQFGEGGSIGTDDNLRERDAQSGEAGSFLRLKESQNGFNLPGDEWVSVILTVVPGLNMDDMDDKVTAKKKDHRRVPSTVAMAEVKAAAAKGESPLGLPVHKGGAEVMQAQLEDISGKDAKATDALASELWDSKKNRMQKVSKYGNLSGWDLRCVIVKSGDDCRQEHLAVQLISHFYDIFQEAGLPLWLRPYEILVASSRTALIEMIPDTASIHSIKSRNPNVSSLRDFFCKKYEEDSPNFKLAQRNFVESMAAYSILCYILQVKDRHNGNLLLDEEGHVIHIDFGFMLSNSPGGVNFESAPFKLTRELLEVMDSDAEGTSSEFFDYFKVLCIQGFLICRKHAERIILLVEMMQDSGYPCFKAGSKTIQNLWKRFHLTLTEEQCVSLVLSLISSSLDAWRTRQYDYYQRVLNGIL